MGIARVLQRKLNNDFFRATKIIIVQLTLKYIWKKNGFIHETATNFSRWRILHQMDARFKNMNAVYSSTKRNIESGCIFVFTTERKCIRNLLIVDIGRVEGLKVITDILNEIFLRNPNTSAYIVMKKFYSYKRDIGENINVFLVRYKFLYHKLQ